MMMVLANKDIDDYNFQLRLHGAKKGYINNKFNLDNPSEDEGFNEVDDKKLTDLSFKTLEMLKEKHASRNNNQT